MVLCGVYTDCQIKSERKECHFVLECHLSQRYTIRNNVLKVYIEAPPTFFLYAKYWVNRCTQKGGRTKTGMPPRRKRPVSSSLSSSSSSHTNNQNNAVKRGKKQTKIPPASGATDVDVDVEMETKPPEVTGTGIGNAASAASAAEGGMASDHIRRLLETLSSTFGISSYALSLYRLGISPLFVLAETSSVLMQLELGHEIADFVLRQTNRPNEDRRCVFRSVVDSICSGNWDQRRAAAALAAAVATKWRHKYKGRKTM